MHGAAGQYNVARTYTHQVKRSVLECRICLSNFNIYCVDPASYWTVSNGLGIFAASAWRTDNRNMARNLIRIWQRHDGERDTRILRRRSAGTLWGKMPRIDHSSIPHCQDVIIQQLGCLYTLRILRILEQRL